MRAPNQAIKRTRHITPTIEDLINALNGATVFSKLDLNSAYHQLELDEASRSMTTFSTHIGLRRYKRLIFGANCSGEIFQDALATALGGLRGVMNVWDDIIVYGNTPEEHTQNLRAALNRIREVGLTLNKKKCKFNQESIKFFGHIFSKEGIQADPSKVEAIMKMPAPEDATAVRSFLGMTNYLSRFLPNYADLTAPLGKLTKREALAIVWACEYFNVYLYGAEFNLITDHKPLEIILNKPKSKPPARIARWSIRLAQYKYKVIYKPEKNNPTDFMSRHPVGKPSKMDKRINAEDYVHLVTNCSVPKTMNLDTIQEATQNDATLQAVIRAIKTGNWIEESKEISVDQTVFRSMSKLKEELAIVEDENNGERKILLRGTRLIIPKSLQAQIIALAHEGHQGVIKTKQLVREKVWFSRIDTMVERICKECIMCQAATPTNTSEPLQMTELPEKK